MIVQPNNALNPTGWERGSLASLGGSVAGGLALSLGCKSAIVLHLITLPLPKLQCGRSPVTFPLAGASPARGRPEPLPVRLAPLVSDPVK